MNSSVPQSTHSNSLKEYHRADPKLPLCKESTWRSSTMPASSFPGLLLACAPLGSSKLFWASTSSAFHIRLGVNYDASVKMSLLTASGLENGRGKEGNSNYRPLALINAHLLCFVFWTQSPHYSGGRTPFTPQHRDQKYSVSPLLGPMEQELSSKEAIYMQ